MNTEEQRSWRQKLVAEAEEWIGTPYISNGLVKGKHGGTDCALLLLGVYQNVGLVSKAFDPRPYPAQWHLHQNAEKYLDHMLAFAVEVPGPPERVPLPGDIVMFKLGRVYSHGGIITTWPRIIHAMGGGRVMPEDVSKNTIGKRALWPLPKRFFSFWPEV
jgi:cell wall-associated NlpC family hydrolase